MAVESGSLIVLGVDNDCVKTNLGREFDCDAQGEGKQVLADAPALGAPIDGKACYTQDRRGMARQFGGFWQVDRGNLPGAQGDEADDLVAVVGKRDIGLAEALALLLAGVLAQEDVECRFAAIEVISLMRGGEPFDADAHSAPGHQLAQGIVGFVRSLAGGDKIGKGLAGKL